MKKNLFGLFILFVIGILLTPVSALANQNEVNTIHSRLQRCSIDSRVKGLSDINLSNIKTRVVCNQKKSGYIPITLKMVNQAVKVVGVNKIKFALILLGV